VFNRSISPWWSVVAGSIAGLFAGGPLMVYSYGIIARPMGVEFGWGRDLLATNITNYLIGNGVGVAVLGWLISRYGIRTPSTIFLLIFGLSFAAVAMLPPSPALFIVTFLLVGFGSAAATAMPYSVAISGFFNARRGLALGIVVAGSGAGAAINPHIAQYLAETVGWRTSFATIGLVVGGMSALLMMVLVRTPPGVTDNRARSGGAAALTLLKLYVSDPRFWIVALAILAMSIAVFGGMASLVPLFADRQIDKLTVTSIISVAGLTSWVGRLAAGYLLDRMFAPALTAIVFMLAAVGFLLLVWGASWIPLAFLGSSLVSLALGAEADLLAYLISRYFRLVDFSRLTGLIWVVWTWGGALGISLASNSFARFASYTPAFIGFAVAMASAAALIMFLGPYVNPVHRAIVEDSTMLEAAAEA
jgi:predicted MFS family arabinose efflux permease